MPVQRGRRRRVLCDCVARRTAANDHCHCLQLPMKVVFGRESRDKNIELCAVLGYLQKDYLSILSPFYILYSFYGATCYFSQNPRAYIDSRRT